MTVGSEKEGRNTKLAPHSYVGKWLVGHAFDGDKRGMEWGYKTLVWTHTEFGVSLEQPH